MWKASGSAQSAANRAIQLANCQVAMRRRYRRRSRRIVRPCLTRCQKARTFADSSAKPTRKAIPSTVRKNRVKRMLRGEEADVEGG